MVAARWALGAIVAATAVSASTDELQFLARLLKRQEPGSPSYNCHDNCGQAIIQGRTSSDVCNDEIFLADYQACLQCAGPDNQDIWQYYGTTLTRDATPCGLSTSPLSGTQPDVGPAVPASTAATTVAQSTSSTAAPTSEASSTETTTTTEASTTSEVSTEEPGTTSSTAEVTASATASETSTPAASESTTGYATASATESASVTSAPYSSASITYAPTGTGSGSGSGNGTATTSSGIVVVTNAANAISGSPVGFYGALALGALYAVAQ
ncbi:hypothetical protein F4677DRAFT_440095 [Hypoxylon crocopeplum]|nr:hypothetical protein F4677DRAFT_440095 [Hypoxylon crocopeplum]